MPSKNTKIISTVGSASADEYTYCSVVEGLDALLSNVMNPMCHR